MCLQTTESVTASKNSPLVKGKAKPAKPVKQFKIETKDDIGKVLDAFLNGGNVKTKFGRYEIDGNSLVYRAVVTDTLSVDMDQLSGLVHAAETGAIVLVDTDLETLKAKVSQALVNAVQNKNSQGNWNYNGTMKVKVKMKRQDLCAIRLNRHGQTLFVGNSSVLGLIGRSVSFGNERMNRQETEIQARMALLIPMVPFSVFQQAKLDINTMELIERGQAETVIRKISAGYDKKTDKELFKDETRHFTGASLFKVGGETFLFDLDRRELEHKIFNPFLVKLTHKAGSIAQAYDGLKPREVKDAEASGLTVARQGEWFFIPVDAATSKTLDILEKIKGNKKRISLQAGPNRPNDADGIQLLNGEVIPDESRVSNWQSIRRDADERNAKSEFYVTGKVSHRGREHADLQLRGWFRAVPNTAISSFTITGDID